MPAKASTVNALRKPSMSWEDLRTEPNAYDAHGVLLTARAARLYQFLTGASNSSRRNHGVGLFCRCPHRSCVILQLIDPLLDLADDVPRERPEMQVKRRQQDDDPRPRRIGRCAFE